MNDITNINDHLMGHHQMEEVIQNFNQRMAATILTVDL